MDRPHITDDEMDAAVRRAEHVVSFSRHEQHAVAIVREIIRDGRHVWHQYKDDPVLPSTEHLATLSLSGMIDAGGLRSGVVQDVAYFWDRLHREPTTSPLKPTLNGMAIAVFSDIALDINRAEIAHLRTQAGR